MNSRVPTPKSWFNSPNSTGAICQTEALGTGALDKNCLNGERQEAGSGCPYIDFRLQTVAGPTGIAEPRKRQHLRGQSPGHRDWDTGPGY